MLSLNLSKNFSTTQKILTSILPKGTSVFALSKVSHHEYWPTKLDRNMVLTNYAFVLCDIKQHGNHIVRSLKSADIEAEILTGMDGKPVRLTNKEIQYLHKLGETFQNVEFVDNNFGYGDEIRVMSGPYNGYKGTISLITKEHVYSMAKIGNSVINVPFIREDIVNITKMEK